MSRSFALVFVLAVSACGDDGGSSKTDAALADVRVFDAPAADCDYVEQSDTTNDTSSAGGVTETTGLTFSNRTVLCGTLDHTHFTEGIMIDGDSYTIDVPVDAALIVRMVAPGAQALEFVGVDVYDTNDGFVGGPTWYGNHGVASVRVPAGKFEILAFALNSEQVTTSVPYRIEITSDMPDTRCPEVTTGGYPEGNDTSDANEVYAFPSGSPIELTSNGADMPEHTNIVLAPDLSIRITGSAVDVTGEDKYEDTDTYEIATGAGTNELAIRLTWSTAGANLDWHLFEQTQTAAVAQGTSTTTGSETKMTAVKPNTTYWLAVSSQVGKTVPADYNATLCPTQFTLP